MKNDGWDGDVRDNQCWNLIGEIRCIFTTASYWNLVVSKGMASLSNCQEAMSFIGSLNYYRKLRIS